MMAGASGSSNAKTKEVLGRTPGYPTWPDGLRAWAAENQASNNTGGGVRPTPAQEQPRLLRPRGCS
jgi:hypothetical protein